MPKALVMAGGTGGHIFPALAVACALRESNWEIQWLGTPDRMEAEIVPAHNFPLHFLPVKGLRGKGVINKLLALWGLLKSVLAAIKLIRQQKPQLIVGFGGYPSGPGGLAAKLCNVPLIIHEQNAVPGLTNRLLGKWAHTVLVGFAHAQARFQQNGINAQVVGNPIREQFYDARQQDKADNTFNLLVIGGSLGAAALNKALPEICANLPQINIVHQCGKGNQYAVTEAYSELGVTAEVTDFIDDVAAKYQWADAVVCRAGALTVTEIAHAGVAACFIPLPHAVDDHQSKNAQVLVDVGAAETVHQHALPDALLTILMRWIEKPEICRQMAESGRNALPKDATMRIVNLCRQSIGAVE